MFDSTRPRKGGNEMLLEIGGRQARNIRMSTYYYIVPGLHCPEGLAVDLDEAAADTVANNGSLVNLFGYNNNGSGLCPTRWGRFNRKHAAGASIGSAAVRSRDVGGRPQALRTS